jgi:hypothetical protein
MIQQGIDDYFATERSIQVAQWNAGSVHLLQQDRRLVEFRELAEDYKYDILCLLEIRYSIIEIRGFMPIGCPYGNNEVGTTALIRQGIDFKRDKHLSNLLSHVPGVEAALSNIGSPSK